MEEVALTVENSKSEIQISIVPFGSNGRHQDLILPAYQDVIGIVDAAPSRILLQELPVQVELADGVTSIVTVHSVDDVVRDGEAGHEIVLKCEFEGKQRLNARAFFK